MNSTGKNYMYYVHTDYLGNYETVTNELGNMVDKLSFDPWGRRRNPNDWTYNNVPQTHLFDRGFTGHEHLDNFDLINLNGRIYDPMLGRMLQPDNYVSSTTSIESFNRYSYANNNPLKFVDPSGNYALPILKTPNIMQYFAKYAGAPQHMQSKYTYNWNTGNYETKIDGETYIVPFDEVYNNYILPNSTNITGSIMNLLNSGSKDITVYMGDQNIVVADTKQLNNTIDNYKANQKANIDFLNGFLADLQHGYGMLWDGGGLPDGDRIDWNTATDGQKIIHILDGIRDARMSEKKYIDMRQLFSNFPKHGSKVELINGIEIGDNSMIVYMNLAIYDNMRINIFNVRMDQVGPFNDVNVNGVIKSGYWDMMELNRAGGNIPILMIQINTNFDTFYNFLYK